MARAGQAIGRGLQETLMPFLLQRFQEKRGQRQRKARVDEQVQNLMKLYADRGLTEDIAEPYVELGAAGMPQPLAALGLGDPQAAGQRQAVEMLLGEVEDEETRELFRTGIKAGAIEPDKVFEYLESDKKDQDRLNRFFKLSRKARNAQQITPEVIEYGKLLNEVLPKADAAKMLAKTVPAMRTIMEQEMTVESGLKQIANGARVNELGPETLATMMGPGKFSRQDLDWLVERFSGVKQRKVDPESVIKIGSELYEAEKSALFGVLPGQDHASLLSIWMKPKSERSKREKEQLTQAQRQFFEKFHSRQTGALAEGVLFSVGRKQYEKMIKDIDGLTAKLNLRPREKEKLDQIVIALWQRGKPPEDVDWIGLMDYMPKSQGEAADEQKKAAGPSTQPLSISERIPLNVIRQAYENFYEEQTRNVRLSD